METEGESALYRLILVIGLATVAVVGLLWWSDGQSPAVQALSRSPALPSPADSHAVGVAWTSFTPTSTTMPANGGTWVIANQGVTITFYVASLTGASVFTFTPQVDQPLDPPLISSYFFQLVGTFVVGGGPVSLDNDIDVVLQYDVSALGDALESTLSYFHLDELPPTSWHAQPTTVDTTQRLVRFSTNETGVFGLGGYGQRVLVPVVLRSSSPAP